MQSALKILDQEITQKQFSKLEKEIPDQESFELGEKYCDELKICYQNCQDLIKITRKLGKQTRKLQKTALKRFYPDEDCWKSWSSEELILCVDLN